MKLFLCSHFSSVGSLIKEEIENKKVAFIPTASLREGYTQGLKAAPVYFSYRHAGCTRFLAFGILPGKFCKGFLYCSCSSPLQIFFF